MKDKELKSLGKFICSILRHEPGIVGIELDEQGYVNVDELIEAVNDSKGTTTFNKKLLDEIVEKNDKHRYSYNEDRTKIRANQGHSIEVNLDLKPQDNVPDILYHGTAKKFLDSIMDTGLNRMKRQYVHLSDNLELAHKVGRRHGEEVVLDIDTKQMVKDGYEFFLSENNVWLIDNVPPGYIKVHNTLKMDSRWN